MVKYQLKKDKERIDPNCILADQKIKTCRECEIASLCSDPECWSEYTWQKDIMPNVEQVKEVERGKELAERR